VVLREKNRRRDGSDVPGVPGFVDFRYYYDDARERFELVNATPEDPDYPTGRVISDPLGFLESHWDAVCNGRLSFPEVRAELKARAKPEPDDHPNVAATRSAATEDSGRSPEVRPESSDNDTLARSSDVPGLVASWTRARDQCRGGARDDPATANACRERETFRVKLLNSGECFGQPGETGYQQEWRPC
jgi:hypothetical protein